MSEREKLLADVTRSIDTLAVNGPYSTAHMAAIDVIRLVVEACCEKMRPKNSRPCDCDTCDCRNSGDLAAVTAWDQQKYDIDLLRSTFLPTLTQKDPANG